MRFQIAGKAFDLDRDAVNAAMRGREPEPTRQHAVEVDGRIYPVKQVLEAATKLDRLDFTSATARRVLGKLGFKLFREA